MKSIIVSIIKIFNKCLLRIINLFFYQFMLFTFVLNIICMGVFQMWDASTGQGFSHYAEHQKRAWSVDFSQLAPTSFASGSDDCSVKLWNINEACYPFYHLINSPKFQDTVIFFLDFKATNVRVLIIFFSLSLYFFLGVHILKA